MLFFLGVVVMVCLCIYLFITKAYPYHFVASSSPEVCFLKSLNQCRGMYK